MTLWLGWNVNNKQNHLKVLRISHRWLPGDVAGGPGCACDWVVDWPTTECVDNHQPGHSHHTYPEQAMPSTPKYSHNNTKLNSQPRQNPHNKIKSLTICPVFLLVHPSPTDWNRRPLSRNFFVWCWGYRSIRSSQVMLTDKRQSWETPPGEEILWFVCCPTVVVQPLKSKYHIQEYAQLFWKSPCWTWAQ